MFLWRVPGLLRWFGFRPWRDALGVALCQRIGQVVGLPEPVGHWRLDFIAAENSMGFHAPQEAARVLGEAIDYARQGEIAALTATAPPAAPAAPAAPAPAR